MPHDLDTALAGISGILVTPYDDAGEIAPARLAPILDRALAAGVHMPIWDANSGVWLWWLWAHAVRHERAT